MHISSNKEWGTPEYVGIMGEKSRERIKESNGEDEQIRGRRRRSRRAGPRRDGSIAELNKRKPPDGVQRA